MSRTVTLRCRRCGHQYVAEFFSAEEVTRLRIRVTSTPSCEKCGSFEIEAN
jgi:hypothetical protein